MVAPAPSPRPDTRVGGKGSALTSDAVYSVSRGLSSVRIDAAALEKLQLSSSAPAAAAAAATAAPTRLLGHELSRAALLVLLSKLVNADSCRIRQVIPLLIEETLNGRAPLERLDFGACSALLSSLLELNGKCLEEIAGSPTADEAFVVENSSAASVAECAVLDSVASSLSTLLDAVAALSCEAARADVSTFDMYGSSDGFSIKDETDVAGDLKMLLSKSKMTGQVEDAAFVEIPTVHGSFREAARLLHARTRVELNSVVKTRKTSVSGNNGKEKALTGLAVHLAAAISAAGESSSRRIRVLVGSIADEDLRLRVVSTIQNGLTSFIPPNQVDLDALFDCLLTEFQMNSRADALHSSYDLLVKLQEVVAWETALALYILETDDSIEKASTEVNGENAKGDKKAGKKKKKTLGNGTSIIRCLLVEHIADGEGLPVSVLACWARELFSFFDPKNPGLNDLLSKIKEIVQSNDIRRLPKIPKGTRDCGKEEMAVREHAFSIILGVFKRHGAVGLDTPVFELRETLMGKYGEDSKLIFDLADQGGEICSLRYDLTVPFARYLASNSITALKRYQIGKVYRRDNPSRGRFREFYQCDFDIAGTYGAMEPDFEVVKVLTELLNELEIGDYEVKLNHRMLLDGMLEICGVPSEKFRTVCSSIDKLDKQPFEQIKKELVEEKGLTVDIAERIGVLVKKRGSAFDILSDLMGNESPFVKHTGSLLALKDLEILFKALEKAKALDKIVFDLSLARGLDYYTGVIFEAVLKGSTQVGSIAAGGRYDNLVGMFSGKQVPAVGISLGIERVFTIMREQKQKQELRSTETLVLVAVLGQDLTVAAELVAELWTARIPAEFSLNKRMDKHIKRAENGGIPWMVIVGDLEKAQGIVKLKDFNANKEESISRDVFVVELQKRLSTQPIAQHYAIA